MRSHAKQATAGSTKRLGKSKPALLLCVLAASVAALALVVGSASGATTRFLVETFGSSAQPAFPADRGMAFDQGASQLYVIDSTNDTISRFNANGTAANFGALGSNVIDGEGAGDETPLGHLAFESNRQREQLAIDESGEATDGNLYATRSASDVVDVFASNGEYKGTLTESTGTGAFGEPCGVAVDDEGTVYVGDRGDDRIHVYDPAGAVPVNADNTASFATVTDPCTLAAGMAATDGFLFVNASTGAQLRKVDAATGEVKYEIATGASTVSVDPATGHVFVARNTGSGSSVDEYDASGAASATLVSSFKPGSTVEGIALSSASEQVYVARSSTENVEVFGPAAIVPDVVTEAPASNTGVRATLAGTVNPDGVELDECFFEWKQGTSGSTPFEQTTPCAQTPAAIGAGTSPVAVSAELDGLKPQGTTYQYRLVAKNPNATVNGSNQNFTTPDTVITQAATGLTPTEATLNGTVNPDGTAITECVFEWGPEQGPLDPFQAYPETATCVPGPGGIGTGTAPVAVQADLTGLHPGTRYAYRLKAANANGEIVGSQMVVQTNGPRIVATWSEDVVRTEATLKTEIDPEGSATTYRFEYGPTTAYGSETPELNAGSDSSVHGLTRLLSDLEPGTTYHYRVIATNGVAVNEGPDLTFTTYERFVVDTNCANQEFRVGPAATLPDCRAYEMVSPVDKNGGDIATLCNINCARTAFNRSSTSGHKFTYSTYKAFGDAVSGPYSNQYIATRGGSGWSSHGISPTRRAGLNPSLAAYADLEIMFKDFTDDLSTAWVYDSSLETLTPDALQNSPNLYQRNNDDDSYRVLTMDEGTSPTLGGTPQMQGHSADGKHAFFIAQRALTPAAATGTSYQLYDYFDGKLHLVSVLPDGTADPKNSWAGGFWFTGNATHGAQTLDNAISTDGSRVFWSSTSSAAGSGEIYMREDPTSPAASTKVIGTGSFWSATPDGTKALIQSSAGELSVIEVDSETSSTVADSALGVLGTSDDLSHIYFVSTEALAAGATAGARNLYLDVNGVKRFIATLSAIDTGEAASTPSINYYSVVSPRPVDRSSRVTSDGTHMVFQSSHSLTGYDNVARNVGQPAVEVYTYDADAAQLKCVSCKPSGDRPIARALQQPYHAIEAPLTNGGGSLRVWAAAWIATAENSLYTPKVLSEDGQHVFFNSFDSLVPRDTNGLQDVYQWEAEGSGGCHRPSGCVSLISTGQSSDRSEFIDATPDGGTVFFETSSSLLAQDTGLIDIYAARMNGGFPPPPPPPLNCVGDACQTPPPGPAGVTPASSSFQGAGDPGPRRNCRTQARRAAKLSQQARRARRNARRLSRSVRSKRLRRRSVRMATRAKRLSRAATRCRQANRRLVR